MRRSHKGVAKVTRDEAVLVLKWYQKRAVSIYHNDKEDTKAFDMAIDALSKPNYETDTEVRLAVVNRHKDKVVLFDAFGEVEYLPPRPTNEDLVQRSDVLELAKSGKIISNDNYEKTVKLINSLPSCHRCYECDEDLLTHEEAWKRIEQTDLISREDAINAFADGWCYYKKGIREVLEKVPSAEPTVIRCKDCIHFDPDGANTEGWGWCNKNDSDWRVDDFCSWGKRGRK